MSFLADVLNLLPQLMFFAFAGVIVFAILVDFAEMVIVTLRGLFSQRGGWKNGGGRA